MKKLFNMLFLSIVFTNVFSQTEEDSSNVLPPSWYDPCTWRAWNIYADGQSNTCVFAGDRSDLSFDIATISGDAHLTVDAGQNVGVVGVKAIYNNGAYPSQYTNGVDFSSGTAQYADGLGAAQVWWNPNLTNPTYTTVTYHFWTGNGFGLGKPCEHYRSIGAMVYPKIYKNLNSTDFSITSSFDNNNSKCDWSTYAFTLTSSKFTGNYNYFQIDWQIPPGWSLAPGESLSGVGKTTIYITPNSKTLGYVPAGIVRATVKTVCNGIAVNVDYNVKGTPQIVVANMAANINICGNNGSRAVIAPQILGGKAPYSYSWDGIWPICTTCSTQTVDVANLYSNETSLNFIVTDANGCTKKQTSILHKDNSSAWQASVPYTGSTSTPGDVLSEIKTDGAGNPVFVGANNVLYTYRYSNSKWNLTPLTGSYEAGNDLVINSTDVVYYIKYGNKAVNKITNFQTTSPVTSLAYTLPASDPSTLSKVYYANQRLFFVNSLGKLGYFTGNNTVRYMTVTLADPKGTVCFDDNGFYYVSNSNVISYYNYNNNTSAAIAGWYNAYPNSFIQGDNFGRVFFANSNGEICFITGNTNVQYPALIANNTYASWGEVGPYFSVNPATGVVYSVNEGGLLRQVYLDSQTSTWKINDFMSNATYNLSALSTNYVKFRYPNVFFKDGDKQLKMAYFYVTTCNPAIIRKAENTNSLESNLNIDTTSIKEQLDKISVFPNPNNGSFSINNPNADDVKLEIYNSLNQKVYEIDLKGGISTHNIDLSKGLYFARFTLADEIQILKVIIE